MSTIVERVRRLPLVIEALAWLVVAWLTLDVMPGHLYRKLLRQAVAPQSERAHGSNAFNERAGRVDRIAWAVRRTSQVLPFRSVCFHRGIAAHRMLLRRRIPSTLHYGVAKTSHALEAHVWVTSCGLDVVGGSEKQRFQEIARFFAELSSYNRQTSELHDA